MNAYNMTDEEILAEMRLPSLLNRVRQAMYASAGRLDQAQRQRRAPSPIEMRRMEFQDAAALIELVQNHTGAPAAANCVPDRILEVVRAGGAAREREAVLAYLQRIREGCDSAIDEAWDTVADAIEAIRAGEHHTGAPGNSIDTRAARPRDEP